MPATVNLVPNPSFEENLAGYNAVGSLLVMQRTGIDPRVGLSCMDISTAGNAGDGVRVSAITPQTTGSHTASIYLRGAGAVTLCLVTNPGGVIQASTPITLTSTWTRYWVTGSVAFGETVYLTVTAASATYTDFSVDSVQIEAGTLTDYCDGDQYGCYWLSTPHNSISVREVPHPIVAAGYSRTDGDLSLYSSAPVPFTLTGTSASSGALSTATLDPVGALDDFAVFPAAEPDPIYGYAIKGNEGVSTGAYGADWVRVYTHFVVPRNYRVSDGDIGTRAAYAEVGLRFDNLPAGKLQYLTNVQMEINDVQTSPATPTTFVPPRQIQVIVKPARINLVKNPRFALSTSLWTTTGDVALTRDTTKGVETTSPTSGCMTLTGTNATTFIEHDFEALIPGHIYTASAYVTWEEGINDLTFEIVGAEAGASAIMCITDGDVQPYGAGGYGEGEYGGGDTADVPPPESWVRVWFQFTATYANDSLRIHPEGDGATGVGKKAWVDQILIEDTPFLPPGEYFDGSYGDDYLWEGDGNLIMIDEFTGADELITNEYAHWNPSDPARVESAVWDMTSGSLFRRDNAGWTGTPDGIDPNATSSNGNNSNVFRMHTRRDDMKDIRIYVKVRNNGIGAGTGAATDGIHIWFRYIDETMLYVASINRRDNTLVIKKKLTGGPSPENGGTYYTLASTAYVYPVGTWQEFVITVNGTSSPVITVSKDGSTLLTVTDTTGTGGAVISAPGSIGIRGDYTDMDIDYVEVRTYATGGAHESRSYYYPDIRSKVSVIQELVNANIPLGLTAATVQYAVPYIQ